MPAREAMMTRDMFNALCEQWHGETAILSSITKKMEHQAFRTIVAQGKQILPFIFDRILYDDRTHWFLLAHAITGESPFPPVFQGRIAAINAFWIVWGYEHGYLDPGTMSDDGCKTNSGIYFEQLREAGLLSGQ